MCIRDRGQIRLAPVELLPGQGLAGMKGQHPGPGGLGDGVGQDVYKRQDMHRVTGGRGPRAHHIQNKLSVRTGVIADCDFVLHTLTVPLMIKTSASNHPKVT